MTGAENELDFRFPFFSGNIYRRHPPQNISSFIIFMSYLKNSFSRFGDTSLQEKINGDNYSILNFYLEQFKDKFPDASKLKDVLKILVNRRNACLMKPCHLFTLLFSSHPPPPLLPSNHFLTSLISSLSP